MLLTLVTVSFALSGCSNEEPFSTATAEDTPRILDPVFPTRTNGELPVVVNINRTDTLSMTLTVTPADHTTVTWYIDGKEIATGRELSELMPAGNYHLKVVAATAAGLSTYREGIVQINPIDGDPWASTVGFERIVAPGADAVLFGDNLEKVTSLLINGKTIKEVSYDAEAGMLHYVVPANLAAGDYRVTMVDAKGNTYGGNMVKVTADALVTTGADRANANSEWVIKGINLDKIASIAVGGKTVNTFIRQSSTELALTFPTLEDGNYDLTGKTKDGKKVYFFTNGAVSATQSVAVTSERTLWEGHYYVSWELPDDNPNKKFTHISTEQFASFTAGSTLRLYYSIKSDDAYHQIQAVTSWWTLLPGTEKQEVYSDGVYEIVLTQEMLDLVQAQNGFFFVGHGYYVDRVSIQ